MSTTAKKTEDLTAVPQTISPVEVKSSPATESLDKPPRKKRQTRKKNQAVVETPDLPSSVAGVTNQKIEPAAEEEPHQKKRQGRVGQRQP